jgi:hypothetical protein
MVSVERFRRLLSTHAVRFERLYPSTVWRGKRRPDIDFYSAVPANLNLMEMAGKGSALAKKYKIQLLTVCQVATKSICLTRKDLGSTWGAHPGDQNGNPG